MKAPTGASFDRNELFGHVPVAETTKSHPMTLSVASSTYRGHSKYQQAVQYK